MQNKKLTNYYHSIWPIVKRHIRTTMPYFTVSKVFNILLAKFEEKIGKSQVKSRPYFIKIEPTNKCNLRCKGCLLHGTEPNRVNQNVSLGSMDIQNFRKTIGQLEKYLVKVSLYSLGEPLIYPNILEMIKYLSDRKIGSVISSNMNYLTPELASGMVKNKLSHLIISLDGAEKEVYDKFRIGGSFDRVIENIKLIQAEKKRQKSKYPLIEIQTIKFPHIGKKEIQDMKNLVKDLGVERFSLKQDSSKYYDNKDQKTGTCFWLYGMPMIKWDGVVQPCCYFYEYKNNDLGDTSQNDINEIWNNDKFQEARKYFKTGKKGPSNLKCYDCGFFKPNK